MCKRPIDLVGNSNPLATMNIIRNLTDFIIYPSLARTIAIFILLGIGPVCALSFFSAAIAH